MCHQEAPSGCPSRAAERGEQQPRRRLRPQLAAAPRAGDRPVTAAAQLDPDPPGGRGGLGDHVRVGSRKWAKTPARTEKGEPPESDHP